MNILVSEVCRNAANKKTKAGDQSTYFYAELKEQLN